MFLSTSEIGCFIPRRGRYLTELLTTITTTNHRNWMKYCTVMLNSSVPQNTIISASGLLRLVSVERIKRSSAVTSLHKPVNYRHSLVSLSFPPFFLCHRMMCFTSNGVLCSVPFTRLGAGGQAPCSIFGAYRLPGQVYLCEEICLHSSAQWFLAQPLSSPVWRRSWSPRPDQQHARGMKHNKLLSQCLIGWSGHILRV